MLSRGLASMALRSCLSGQKTAFPGARHSPTAPGPGVQQRYDAGFTTRRSAAAFTTRAWQQVVDPASGEKYWWNTATDETAWELPSSVAPVIAMATRTAERLSQAINASASLISAYSNSEDHHHRQSRGHLTFDELYDILVQAYAADGSGMLFWETARAHRDDNVFEVEFFEFLADRIDSGEDADMADKVRARLSNPLLR
jgi:hypothetical protein